MGALPQALQSRPERGTLAGRFRAAFRSPWNDRFAVAARRGRTETVRNCVPGPCTRERPSTLIRRDRYVLKKFAAPDNHTAKPRIGAPRRFPDCDEDKFATCCRSRTDCQFDGSPCPHGQQGVLLRGYTDAPLMIRAAPHRQAPASSRVRHAQVASPAAETR